MKTSIKNYFTFSRTDRRGLLSLVLVLLFIFAFTLLSQFMSSEPSNFANFEQQIDTFRQHLSLRQADAKQEWEESQKKYRKHTSFAEGGYIDREYDNYYKRKYYNRNNNYYNNKPYNNNKGDEPKALAQPFPFNPNELTYEQGVQLGLSPKVSHTIVNYLEKKGKFRYKEDLKKIYGVTESDYSRLEPYMQLDSKSKHQISDKTTFSKDTSHNSPATEYETASERIAIKKDYNAANSDNAKTENAKDPKKFKDPNVKIDINTADTSEWQKLRGIGSTRAKMIVKYRTSLGGFATIEQVGETYSLKDVFDDIKGNLLNPNPNSIQKININTATYEELDKHPYLSGKQANIILKYRKQHGKFTNIADLQKTDVVDAETLRKITPYLTLGN